MNGNPFNTGQGFAFHCQQCGGTTCTKAFCHTMFQPVVAAPPAPFAFTSTPTLPLPSAIRTLPPPTPALPAWPANLFCDRCKTRPIVGVRVRCVTCADTDFCGACDRLNDQRIEKGETPLHPANHIYVKSRAPPVLSLSSFSF